MRGPRWKRWLAISGVLAVTGGLLAPAAVAAGGYGRYGGHGGDGGYGHRGGVRIGIGVGFGGYPWGYGYGYGVAAPGWYGYPAYGYPAYAVAPPVVITSQQPAVIDAAPELPAQKAAPDPIFYPRNGQSADQTEADRQACNRWAVTVPNAVGDASVFQRATLACMDGRGYTVR